MLANILPISELTENPEHISELCHAQNDPIYLTKDGYGDMVVLSINQYELIKSQSDAYLALLKGGKTEPHDTRPAAAVHVLGEEGLIEKLPLEDVKTILQKEVKKQQTSSNFGYKRRSP